MRTSQSKTPTILSVILFTPYLAASAFAQQVYGFLECVDSITLDNGIQPQLMHVATFGYMNPLGAEVSVPVGRYNLFLPGTSGRGQTSTFLPGYQRWHVTAGASDQIAWGISNSMSQSAYTYAYGQPDPAFGCSDPSITPFLIPTGLKLLRGNTYPGLELSKVLWAAPPAGTPTITAAVYQGSNNVPSFMNMVPSGDLTISNVQVTSNSVRGDVSVLATNERRYHAVVLKMSLNGRAVAVKTLQIETFQPCPIAVIPSALPAGVVGFGYLPITLSGTGATGPYTFEVGGGALPAGLQLVNGAISGVPTEAGTFHFTLNTISSDPCMARQTFTLDIAGPSCATDVTDRMAFTLGGFRQNLATGRWQQTVTLRNTGAAPIAGPISLALQSISANGALFNANGSTRCAVPPGRPYVVVSLAGSAALASGQSAAVTLEFTNSSPSQAITYSPRVLAGGAGQ